jgi:hypothetical protein
MKVHNAPSLDATVTKKSESYQKWLLGRPLTTFGLPYSGIMPPPVNSIFQMTENGILPYPEVGQAQRQFHTRGIPHGAIPYEELDCTSEGNLESCPGKCEFTRLEQN